MSLMAPLKPRKIELGGRLWNDNTKTELIVIKNGGAYFRCYNVQNYTTAAYSKKLLQYLLRMGELRFHENGITRAKKILNTPPAQLKLFPV